MEQTDRRTFDGHADGSNQRPRPTNKPNNISTMVKILSKKESRRHEAENGFSGIIGIPVDSKELEAVWVMPADATGIVLFAHGSGSSRHSRRNLFVASRLGDAVLGTVLLDLLSKAEETEDRANGRYRFDIPFLTDRLIAATHWIQSHPHANGCRIGYFGASTGAAAALTAGAILGDDIGAIVSRGGRPDLAFEHLSKVTAPTLLIVGERDEAVAELNRDAYAHLVCPRKMAVIPGATHLFEEPGALDKVANLASRWFEHHLATREEDELAHTPASRA
jgi:dienelactone hydrolase